MFMHTRDAIDEVMGMVWASLVASIVAALVRLIKQPLMMARAR